MNRLTKDLHTPHDDTTYAEVVKDAIDRENIVLTKLKHYEDIEDELGCPLEVVYNAQVNGFYGKTKDNEICFYNPVEDFIIIDFRLGRLQVALSTDFYNVMTFYLSDYKKTWWLSETKEE